MFRNFIFCIKQQVFYVRFARVEEAQAAFRHREMLARYDTGNQILVQYIFQTYKTYKINNETFKTISFRCFAALGIFLNDSSWPKASFSYDKSDFDPKHDRFMTIGSEQKSPSGGKNPKPT